MCQCFLFYKFSFIYTKLFNCSPGGPLSRRMSIPPESNTLAYIFQVLIFVQVCLHRVRAKPGRTVALLNSARSEYPRFTHYYKINVLVYEDMRMHTLAAVMSIVWSITVTAVARPEVNTVPLLRARIWVHLAPFCLYTA